MGQSYRSNQPYIHCIHMCRCPWLVYSVIVAGTLGSDLSLIRKFGLHGFAIPEDLKYSLNDFGFGSNSYIRMVGSYRPFFASHT